MKSPIVQNLNAPQIGLDSSILSVLPFPALIFDLATMMVVKSNSFFCNENDCIVLSLLNNYDFDFLDDDDFRKISKSLYSNQNYIIHKLHEKNNEIRTYEVHEVGVQAVLGRQDSLPTPWLTERHGYDPTCYIPIRIISFINYTKKTMR